MQNQQTASDGVAAAATASSSSSSSSSANSTDLLLEAARLSQAAYADTAAPPSGWTAVALAEVARDGVQLVDVGALAGLPGAITSAAHVYEGSPDGESTLAIAFRGTDEGANEFAFQATPLPPKAQLKDIEILRFNDMLFEV